MSFKVLLFSVLALATNILKFFLQNGILTYFFFQSILANQLTKKFLYSLSTRPNLSVICEDMRAIWLWHVTPLTASANSVDLSARQASQAPFFPHCSICILPKLYTKSKWKAFLEQTWIPETLKRGRPFLVKGIWVIVLPCLNLQNKLSKLSVKSDIS